MCSRHSRSYCSLCHCCDFFQGYNDVDVTVEVNSAGMVFVEGIFVGEPHCDEEEANVFQEAHMHYHHGKTEEEDPCTRPDAPGQPLSLRETCLRHIATRLGLSSSLQSLPYELLESVFHLVRQRNALDDTNVQLFANLTEVDFSALCPARFVCVSPVPYIPLLDTDDVYLLGQSADSMLMAALSSFTVASIAVSPIVVYVLLSLMLAER